MRLTLFIIVLTTYIASGQNTDLVVTTNGNSIACEILQVNDSVLVLNMRFSNRNMQTTMSLDEIKEYKYDVVKKGMYRYKAGTSYIIGEKYSVSNPPNTAYPISSETYSLENLQNVSKDEFIYYSYKAQKTKKTGTIVTLAGASATIIGLGLVGGHISYSVGTVMVLGGLGSTAVGLPIWATGKVRMKKVDKALETEDKTVSLDLKPCTQYNLMAQKYQPALTLRITF